MKKNIPFLDLQIKDKLIQNKIDKAIAKSLSSFHFIKGEPVARFEKTFARFLNAKHCIATGNGTDSLFIILKCLGIKSGDEVITPALSWISSAETISLCGAKPVFVDVSDQTYVMDPSAIQKKITAKSKAIVVVHLYGQAAPVTDILQLCKKHKLFLIEDCAQAHLTQEKNEYVGTFGHAAAFSFYPTKNLGAYGDAGCILTENAHLATRLRRFANHGALLKNDHIIEGTNSRMDTIQAAVLLSKLRYLKYWNRQRIQNARHYSAHLDDEKNIITPYIRNGTRHTFHIYAIRAKRRNELMRYLSDHGIQTLVHYPKALPYLPAYQSFNYKPEDFPSAYKLQKEMLSLPIYPELSEHEIIYICQKIKDFYRKYS